MQEWVFPDSNVVIYYVQYQTPSTSLSLEWNSPENAVGSNRWLWAPWKTKIPKNFLLLARVEDCDVVLWPYKVSILLLQSHCCWQSVNKCRGDYHSPHTGSRKAQEDCIFQYIQAITVYNCHSFNYQTKITLLNMQGFSTVQLRKELLLIKINHM